MAKLAMRRLILLGALVIALFGVKLPAFVQSPLPSPTPTPDLCRTPPEDYTRIRVNNAAILNQRTLAMLEYAQEIYGGPIQITSTAIVQGSYNTGEVALSFGTHDGGGAVDISVRNVPVDWSIRYEDIPPLIAALRQAGFAAWYRDDRHGMSPHIHAIAIGDAELSRAAQLQLRGRYGYFRAYNGLPQTDGQPQADEHAESFIFCDWMAELGYEDLRGGPLPAAGPYVFEAGQAVLVNTILGGELNLRQEPSLNAPILARMPSETPLQILGDARLNQGYRWWLVKTAEGELGWAVEAADGGYTLVPAD
jgi:hypothetical protein